VNLRSSILLKDYNNLIKELLNDIENFHDNECIYSSKGTERRYIIEKAPRIKQTIQYFDYILKEEKYKDRNFKILDIGTSPFTFLYKKYFNSGVSTVDLTDSYKSRCELNNIEFKKCNILKEDIPFPDNEFDIVIFTEVFEHLIGPPQLIFGRIRRVLKNGGILVFSTLNISSYYNLVKLLLGKSILTPVNLLYKEETPGNWVSHGYGHWRKFTMKEILNLLSEFQFKIVKYKYIMKPYLYIKTKNPFKFVRRLAWNSIVSILPATLFILIIANKE